MTGRFAPSPTGRMHLGNVFTALLAWLSVRSQDGEMVLRIEDLDPDRSREEYVRALKEDLRWLGLTWDREMPRQSGRGEVYARHFDRLARQNLVYPCYCTRNELHSASAPHAEDGRLIYAGTCRDSRRRNGWQRDGGPPGGSMCRRRKSSFPTAYMARRGKIWPGTAAILFYAGPTACTPIS